MDDGQNRKESLLQASGDNFTWERRFIWHTNKIFSPFSLTQVSTKQNH